MALTFSLIDTWDDGKRVHVSGTIAASGNYTTGGDTLDLSQSPLVASAQPPINGTAWMDGLAGYDYVFMPGTAMNSNKVKIFQQGRGRRRISRTRRGRVPRRNHRRFHHLLRHLQEAAVSSVGFSLRQRKNAARSRHTCKTKERVLSFPRLRNLRHRQECLCYQNLRAPVARN